jgi:hypothetical protein
LQCISDELSSIRQINFSEWQKYEFDCNIQQIKKDQFEILYYGLFFSDVVVIFRIKSDEIGDQIYYSNKQHKGNEGEGQFHLNEKTLQIHIKNYLYQVLSYEELYSLLK